MKARGLLLMALMLAGVPASVSGCGSGHSSDSTSPARSDRPAEGRGSTRAPVRLAAAPGLQAGGVLTDVDRATGTLEVIVLVRNVSGSSRTLRRPAWLATDLARRPASGFVTLPEAIDAFHGGSSPRRPSFVLAAGETAGIAYALPSRCARRAQATLTASPAAVTIDGRAGSAPVTAQGLSVIRAAARRACRV